MSDKGEQMEPPREVLYVQFIYGGYSTNVIDPRKVHDNGKPVYVYRLDHAASQLNDISHCDKCDLCEDHHD